jgi:hypothetical protein
MNKKIVDMAPMQLPKLQDPAYWGVTMVQNILTIVGALFAVLGIVIVIVTAFIQVDITIKANASRIDKCPMGHPNYCVLLQITAAQAEHIAQGNPVRIEVIADGHYRRKIIHGKVLSIEEHTKNNDQKSPHTVTVQLAKKNLAAANLSPTFGVIIVGSQSGWKLLRSAIGSVF